MLAAATIKIWLYLAVAGALTGAMATDIRARKIPNIIPMAVGVLFVLVAATEAIDGWTLMDSFVWPLVSGAVVFSVCLGLFALNMMGGGDVKLLVAMALIAGPALTLPFVLQVTLAGGLVALITLAHSRIFKRHVAEPAKVPYGIAIAVGGYWVCFQKVSALSA